MSWNTQYDFYTGERDHEKFRQYAQSGSPEYEDFSGVLDEQGNIKLISKGKVNLYDEIQSYKDSVDINVIVSRYLNGDESALDQVQSMFGDLTRMPKDIHEAYTLLTEAREIFDTAPLEVRQEYDHNFAKFIKAATSDDFISKWQNFGKVVDEIKDKESDKSDES